MEGEFITIFIIIYYFYYKRFSNSSGRLLLLTAAGSVDIDQQLLKIVLQFVPVPHLT